MMCLICQSDFEAERVAVASLQQRRNVIEIEVEDQSKVTLFVLPRHFDCLDLWTPIFLLCS